MQLVLGSETGSVQKIIAAVGNPQAINEVVAKQVVHAGTAKF
jgi:hypothetical protein